jgi:hypothetical protein
VCLEPHLRRLGGDYMALVRRYGRTCPKISRKPRNLRQKRHSRVPQRGMRI